MTGSGDDRRGDSTRAASPSRNTYSQAASGRSASPGSTARRPTSPNKVPASLAGVNAAAAAADNAYSARRKRGGRFGAPAGSPDNAYSARRKRGGRYGAPAGSPDNAYGGKKKRSPSKGRFGSPGRSRKASPSKSRGKSPNRGGGALSFLNLR